MSTTSSAASELPSAPPSRAVMGVLVLVTLLAMGRLCGAEFSGWDDNETIHQNAWMNPPTGKTLKHYWTHEHMGLYVPVTYTVWAGLAGVAQVETPDERGIALNPYVFHTANVLVHLLNVLIVYAILRRVVRRQWAAGIGAMVFAVHPVQVETVGWVSGMKDLLCGSFVLGAVWNYLVYCRFRISDGGLQRRRLHYWAAIGLMVLGMLSKPTAVVTPVLLVVLDLWVMGRDWRQVARSVWPFVVVAVPGAVLAKMVQDVASKAPVWARPMIALDALAFYLGKLVWPARLGVDYGRQPAYVMSRGAWWWAAGIVPLVLGGAAWLGRKKAPVLLAALAVFVAGMAPVLGFTAFMFQGLSTTADHYLYLPMLGVGLGAAWVMNHWPTRWMHGGAAVAVAALVVRSAVQAGMWSDDETLHRHMVDVNPRSHAAHLNLASAIEFRARTQGSEALREQAIWHLRESLRLKPENPRALQNLSILMMKRGQIDEAIRLMLEAIRIADETPAEGREELGPSYRVLGAVLAKRGRYQEAVRMYRKALEYEPGNRQVEQELAEVQRLARAPATRESP